MEPYYKAVDALRIQEKRAKTLRLALFRMQPTLKLHAVKLGVLDGEVWLQCSSVPIAESLAALVPLKLELHYRGSSSVLEHYYTDQAVGWSIHFQVKTIRKVRLEDCTFKTRKSTSGWRRGRLLLGDYELADINYNAGERVGKNAKKQLFEMVRNRAFFADRYEFVL